MLDFEEIGGILMDVQEKKYFFKLSLTELNMDYFKIGYLKVYWDFEIFNNT